MEIVACDRGGRSNHGVVHVPREMGTYTRFSQGIGSQATLRVRDSIFRSVRGSLRMWYEPHGIILPQPAKGSLESRCKVPRILVFHVRRLVHVVRHSCAVDTETSHVYVHEGEARSFVSHVYNPSHTLLRHSAFSRNPEPAQSALESRFHWNFVSIDYRSHATAAEISQNCWSHDSEDHPESLGFRILQFRTLLPECWF